MNNSDVTQKKQAFHASVDEEGSLISASVFRGRINNLYPSAEWDARSRAIQKYGLRMIETFTAADRVDMICALFDWRLLGQGAIQEQSSDDDFIDRGASLEWAYIGVDDRYTVRLELGDEPQVLVQHTAHDDWELLVGGAWALPNVLGDWTEALRQKGLV